MSEILSVKQRHAVHALAGGASIEDAAAAAGVTTRTLYRWRQSPLFMTALQQADQDAIGEIARTLSAASLRAVAYLVEILNTKKAPPSLRLRAASEILKQRGAFFELSNLAERLDALEGQLGLKGFSDNGHR